MLSTTVKQEGGECLANVLYPLLVKKKSGKEEGPKKKRRVGHDAGKNGKKSELRNNRFGKEIGGINAPEEKGGAQPEKFLQQGGLANSEETNCLLQRHQKILPTALGGSMQLCVEWGGKKKECNKKKYLLRR